MDPHLPAVIKQFQVQGHLCDCKPYGSGHIHDTYRVVCNSDGQEHDYLLQQINDRVFHHIPAMMDNIERVTQTLAQQSSTPDARHCLRLVPTITGESFWQDPHYGQWRMYDFVTGSISLDVAQHHTQIEQAALAYGHFLTSLQSLPAESLHETIAHFHDGQVRYRNLQEAIADDSCQRLHQVQEEVSFIEAHRDILQRPLQLQTEGQLPLRVTHNDTKLNNVLIDEQTGAGLCVIDLDTVMPGLVLYDFGDMVRTMICDAPEDEPDSTQIHIDLDRFEAIARGFSQGIDNLLTTEEVDSLVLGAHFMPLIMATRFLTDFLQGDIYYKTDHLNHNLDRCRVQLALTEQLLDHTDELCDIIRRVFP